MDASIAGVNGATWHFGDDASTAAIAAGSRALGGGTRPYMKARRLAAAIMNCMWSGSAASNLTGAGSRLGGDQKGTPCDVFASDGKLCSNCTTRDVKYDSNFWRAQPTQSSHAAARPSTSTSKQPADMPHLHDQTARDQTARDETARGQTTRDQTAPRSTRQHGGGARAAHRASGSTEAGA
eukprot:3505730-Prymnesium_polylepis.1